MIAIKQAILKRAIDHLAVIDDEVLVKITHEGLSTVMVDKAHVMMAFATLPKSAFFSYAPEPTSPESVALDVPKLASALALGKGDDMVIVNTDGTSMTLKIGSSLTRTMRLLDAEKVTAPRVPTLNLGATFSVEASHLQRIVKASKDVGHAVSITTSEDGVKISCESDMESVEMTLSLADLSYLATDGSYRSMYPQDMIAQLLKPISSSAILRVEMDKDYPIKISHDTDEMSISYVLAPRIESD